MSDQNREIANELRAMLNRGHTMAEYQALYAAANLLDPPVAKAEPVVTYRVIWTANKWDDFLYSRMSFNTVPAARAYIKDLASSFRYVILRMVDDKPAEVIQ